MADDKQQDTAPVKDDPPYKPESDKARSKRRAGELIGFLDEHMARVKKAHEDYPTPSPPARYQDMTIPEQERWNQKRVVLDKANRDYHFAVKDAVQRHQNEEVV